MLRCLTAEFNYYFSFIYYYFTVDKAILGFAGNKEHAACMS